MRYLKKVKKLKERSAKTKIKLEVVLSQMETQREDGESLSIPKEWRYVYNYPTSLIISDPSKGVTTRNSLRNICGNIEFLSQIEP